MPGDSSVTARVFTESGGWGLPTIDADGLAAIALLRFADIPFSISPGASPSMTNANVLPVVIFEKSDGAEPSVCAGLASLIAVFTADMSLPDPNNHLTPFMIAESTAFATLVTSRFGPARLHEFYVNDKNYADIYHTLLEKSASFPLNRVLPFLRRREIRQSLKDRSADSIYFDASVALAALSTRLGDRSKFFYGDEPSVLDAIVFGYLAPVLYIPLPSTDLRGQVAKFGNLVGFVGRVRQLFFTQEGHRIVGELDGDSILEARRKEAERTARDASGGFAGGGSGGGVGGGGSSGGGGGGTSGRQQSSRASSEETEAEVERKKWNNYFIWGSLGVFAVHVLLGNEMEFDFE